MNKTILGVMVVLVGIVLGTGSAFLVSQRFVTTDVYANRGIDAVSACNRGASSTNRGSTTSWREPGMMMGGQGRYATETKGVSGERISIEDAVKFVEAEIANSNPALEIREVMAFEENFYAVIGEVGSEKAAFELLVDPYTGQVFPEYGPNMMWNLKYGHMSRGSSWLRDDNVSQAQARSYAQEYLDGFYQDAEVEGDGYTFYGYYTFDFEVGGQIAGMLSVNASSGKVWYHSWHGEFIQEMEITE